MRNFSPKQKTFLVCGRTRVEMRKKIVAVQKNDDKDRASNRSLDRIAPRMSFEDSRTKQKKGQGKSVTTKIVSWSQKRRQG